jgi:hypothetical protein
MGESAEEEFGPQMTQIAAMESMSGEMAAGCLRRATL